MITNEWTLRNEIEQLKAERDKLWQAINEKATLMDAVTEGAKNAVSDERARIRQELEEWLIGRIDPKDAGLHNGRRIADEINRICPVEG